MVVRGVAGGRNGRGVVARLLRLRGLVFVVFVVVVRGDGDASGDEADRANRGKGRRANAAAACGGAVIGEGLGKDVFGGDGDRVVVEAAVRLGADQRAFATGVVVVDDELWAAVAVEGDEEVVAVARGADVGQAVNLVVGAVDGFDVLFARAVERVLGDGVAVGVFEGDGVHGR